MSRRTFDCPHGTCTCTASGGVRDCPASAVELAKLARARRLTDPRKLAAMMPAWLKASLFKPPPPIKYDLSQRFPSWTAARAIDCTRDASEFPSLKDSVAEYVAAWDALHYYVSPEPVRLPLAA